MVITDKESECLSSGFLHTRWMIVTLEDYPVYLTGSTRELGEWNPDRALPLSVQHVGHHLNDWSIDLTLPRGQTIEFKFIQKLSDGKVRWEEGKNRIITVAGPEAMIHWGAFR